MISAKWWPAAGVCLTAEDVTERGTIGIIGRSGPRVAPRPGPLLFGNLFSR